MTETCPKLSVPSLPPICRICLGTDDVRNMTFEEINGYQKLTDMHSLALSDVVGWTVCWVCGHQLRKYVEFRQRCLKALPLFNIYHSQNPDIYSTLQEKGHSFTQKILSSYSIAPDTVDPCDTDVKLEHFELGVVSPNLGLCDERNISDDDLPLTMFKDENEVVTKKVKKRKNKLKTGKRKSSKSTSEINSESENMNDLDKTEQPKLRAGFSSRMRQETEEYVVIKLTREQVVEEMQSVARSERYRLSPYKCGLCVRAFNFPDVLTKHMRKHSQEAGTFECSMCSQRCPSAVSLRGHIKSHTTRYECKVCGAVRRSRQHLVEHRRTQHTSHAPTYHCQRCNFNTTKRTVIQRHVRTTHREADAQHACTLCTRTFNTVEALRVHTSRHDKSSSLCCEQCGRRFIYASLLRKHRREAHERRDYYCVECDVHFGSPYNLQLHFKKAKRHRDTSSVQQNNA